MELEKKYVPVTVHFDANGKMRPIEIEFDEIRRYHIDKILDVRRAACQSVGGVGERYTCRIRGRESYLWFEKAAGVAGSLPCVEKTIYQYLGYLLVLC